MGTPDFAVAPLEKLLEAGYEVVGVVTNPDKPAGRGQKIQESPVKKFAIEKGLTVLQPEKFRDESFLSELAALKADLQIVVAFKMLPEVVWNMPRLGTVNLHASLLPDYRGAAPINRVIMNGEKMTGISTFLLAQGMDTGKVIFREEVEISDDMTAGELHDLLMVRGSDLLVKTADAIESGDFPLLDQDVLLAGREPLHAPKIFKEDMRIDWCWITEKVYNHIRGLAPFPVAWTELVHVESGETHVLKVYKAEKSNKIDGRKPGELLSDGKNYLLITTENGSISLKEVQLSGKKRLPIDEFLRGFKWGEYRIG